MLEIRLVHKDAKMPTRAYYGDAGVDAYSIVDLVVPAKGFGEAGLGIALNLEPGYWAQIQTRSSFGKKGVQVHAGVIDQGYKGELSVFLFNHSDNDLVIKKGDKIAQIILHRLQYDGVLPEINEARGARGYGSSNSV